jgi:outer membrane translocation and assembly module TamA
MLVQSSVEYRSPMWRKVGFAVFMGLGAVAQDFKHYEMRYVLPSYGAGLRIRMNEKEKLNLRFDYARGHNTDNFYLTVGEAF